MARPDHFGDCAGTWNRISKELFHELGMSIPYDALAEIRRLRAKRGGKQGNTEMKDEVKILLAIRAGIPWQHAVSREIRYIVPRSDGGKDELANLSLTEF